MAKVKMYLFIPMGDTRETHQEGVYIFADNIDQAFDFFADNHEGLHKLNDPGDLVVFTEGQIKEASRRGTSLVYRKLDESKRM